MQRNVFERYVVDGFRTSKVESVALTAQGRKIFAGTSEGNLLVYESRCEGGTAGSRQYGCRLIETVRKSSKDRKPVQSLIVAETWRVVIGLVEGTIVAYDSQFYQQLGAIQDAKTYHLFSINEKQGTLIAVNKKKLTQYSWQSPGFNQRREHNLSDIPKNILAVRHCAIVAYKKFYECVDLNTGVVTRMLDVEKEHRMVLLEIPGSFSFRADCVLVSLGTQGVVLETQAVTQGQSFAFGSAHEERIEWSAPPTAVQLLNPFLVSLLSDASVEVHSLANLVTLQKITWSSPSNHALSLAVSPETGVPNVAVSLGQHGFVCNGDQLTVLRMVPLATQIEALVAANSHEEAIHLCQICENKQLIAGIDVSTIYEANAFTMLARGDFEKAVQNFILAGTDFVLAASNFPDFIPLNLQHALNMTATGGKKYTGAVLHRAAQAVAVLCDHHRADIVRRAERAEKVREAGFMATSTQNKGRPGTFSTVVLPSSANNAASEEDEITNPEEDITRAVLCDTMYLFALMNCHPPKKQQVIDLLKTTSTNRCQIESCSVLLASHGDAYIEALLWLYRSQHQHARVLAALSEDKCVTIGGWTRDQFYRWTAEYLQWLWYQDEDATLPKQALQALKPVLEYDAELGLCVLVCRPQYKSSFGGKGVTMTEVLTFLRSTTPRINYSRGALNFSSGFTSSSTSSARGGVAGASGVYQNDKVVQAVLADTQLVNGHALGVAFLECLVNSGEAPANLHDEFAQLLVEGLPLDEELQAQSLSLADLQDLTVKREDNETVQLYKIYRRKLQHFLSYSTDYHPQKVLSCLPRSYLQEYALVLPRLGRHREVLKLYWRDLQRPDLAEAYCDRIYTVMMAADSSQQQQQAQAAGAKPQKRASTTAGPGSAPAAVQQQMPINLSSPGEIYLLLFEVILDDGALEFSGDSNRMSAAQSAQLFRPVIALAEKNYDRFDVNAFLELLPRQMPVAMLLRYLQVVYEHLSARRRNFQVIHQLLRMREVSLRNTLPDLPPPASQQQQQQQQQQQRTMGSAK